jgi:hypothetical protein
MNYLDFLITAVRGACHSVHVEENWWGYLSVHPTSCDHDLEFVRTNGCLSSPYFDAELMLIRGIDKMNISDAVVDVDAKDMERAELARAGLGRLHAGR